MAGNARNDLVSALRSKIADDRATVASFTLKAVANSATVLAEVSNGFLTTTVTRGEGIKDIRWNLSDPKYSTIGRLVQELRAQKGYTVTTENSLMTEHLSQDLRLDGVPDISKDPPATFKHRIWSDDELIGFLTEAINAHNPNYSVMTVPPPEHGYVLKKAAAAAYRVLAADTVRRKGLDTEPKTLLDLAKDLEDQYDTDLKRQRRVVPVPKADESKMGAGEIIQGGFSRMSLRRGYQAPSKSALPPTPPKFYEAVGDIEDTNVRLRWSVSRDPNFVYYELWRDTQPEVDRSLTGRLDPQVYGLPQLPVQSQYSRASTSVQVLGATVNRVSPVFDGFFFATASEMGGLAAINATFIDGLIQVGPGGAAQLPYGTPLEPDFTYYYRLYLINRNGEVAPSDVQRLRTRVMRARVKRQGTSIAAYNALIASDAIVPVRGTIAGGDTVTLKGTYFHAGMKVTIGGKDCPVVVTDANNATCTSPSFSNPDYVNQQLPLVITSTTGLRDIIERAWTVTP